MNDRKNRPISDAEWYFRKEPETERFYEIFFQLCRKYNVHWASATLKEKELLKRLPALPMSENGHSSSVYPCQKFALLLLPENIFDCYLTTTSTLCSKKARSDQSYTACFCISAIPSVQGYFPEPMLRGGHHPVGHGCRCSMWSMFGHGPGDWPLCVGPDGLPKSATWQTYAEVHGTGCAAADFRDRGRYYTVQ